MLVELRKILYGKCVGGGGGQQGSEPSGPRGLSTRMCCFAPRTMNGKPLQSCKQEQAMVTLFFFRKCPLVRDGVGDGGEGGEGGAQYGCKRATGGILAMTEMFCALIVSRSTSWLCCCTIILQDVTIGGNWVTQGLFFFF